MARNVGKQGHSLTPDSNGNFDSEDLRAMYAHWLTLVPDSKGLPMAGAWMDSLIPNISLHSLTTSPSHPSATFLFTPQPAHCNRHNTLHGGCAATVFDYLTTLPLNVVAKPGGYWQQLGVTRNLSVTYLRPVKAGEDVLVECEVVQVSRRMAVLRGVMRRKEDGKVLMICEHQKVNVDKEANKL